MKGAQRYARSNEPQRHWILSKHEAKDAKVKETRKPESRMRRQVSSPVRRGARRKGQQWTSLVAYPAVKPAASHRKRSISPPPHLDSGATSTRFSVVIAGSRGTPFVWRRVGINASEWTVASDTPRAPCALWVKSSWGVPNGVTDRMVAARPLPAMI